MKRDWKWIATLLLPIVVLLIYAGMKEVHLRHGFEVVFPIEGFDPRDILSGHYLTYRVDYGIITECWSDTWGDRSVHPCVCVLTSERKPKTEFFGDCPARRSQCVAVIQGECRNSRFESDIERFYIPENKAGVLDQVVRNKKGEIVLSVSAEGKPLLKDLLIDGKSWREYQK